MMTYLGKMEAETTYEKTEPDPGMMQSTEEHQEISKGEATVNLVREPRKRCRSGIWPQSTARSKRKGSEQVVSPRGDRPSPAGWCPAVQKWHGKKGTSSGLLRPKEIVDCKRDWSSLAKGQPEKAGRSGRHVGWIRKAALL
jgi:hypothetical protein